MNKIKLVICAMFGNCFSAYDFIIYQILILHISNNFFHKDIMHPYLIAQLVYAVGIISRPLGGLIFGYLADLKGRKLILEKTIMLSGIATATIGLIPSYEKIGIISTILLIFLRAIQGMALGGEQGASLAFLIEHSSPKTKGFLSSFCCSGQQLGLLMATLAPSFYGLLVSLSNLIENWRLIFISSFFVGMLGYWIRKNTNETVDFLLNQHCEEYKTNLFQDTKTFIKQNKNFLWTSTLLVVFGILISFAIFFIGDGYFKNFSGFTYVPYIMSTVVIISIPIFGALSDKIGRKILISHSSLAIATISMIFFEIIKHNPSYHSIFVAILISITCGAYLAVAPTLIAELLPVRTRCINFAIFYTIPAGITASITPALCSWLIAKDPIYISYSIIFLAVCLLLSLSKLIDPTAKYNKLDIHSYEYLKP